MSERDQRIEARANDPSAGGVGSARRGRRRGTALAAGACLVALVATGCMRVDMGFAVHDAETMGVTARVTMHPALVELGDLEAEFDAMLQQDVPVDVEGYSFSTERVSDVDGWTGLLVEMSGPFDPDLAGELFPLEEMMGQLPLDLPAIEQTDAGWRYALQGDPMGEQLDLGADMAEFASLAELFDLEGFRVSYSVTLPGHPVTSTSTDVETRDGMTTARWTFDDLGIFLSAPFDLLLVTDTTVAASDGPGAGETAGIIVGAIAAIALVVLWEQRRRRNSAPPDPVPADMAGSDSAAGKDSPPGDDVPDGGNRPAAGA